MTMPFYPEYDVRDYAQANINDRARDQQQRKKTSRAHHLAHPHALSSSSSATTTTAAYNLTSKPRSSSSSTNNTVTSRAGASSSSRSPYLTSTMTITASPRSFRRHNLFLDDSADADVEREDEEEDDDEEDEDDMYASLDEHSASTVSDTEDDSRPWLVESLLSSDYHNLPSSESPNAAPKQHLPSSTHSAFLLSSSPTSSSTSTSASSPSYEGDPGLGLGFGLGSAGQGHYWYEMEDEDGSTCWKAHPSRSGSAFVVRECKW